MRRWLLCLAVTLLLAPPALAAQPSDRPAVVRFQIKSREELQALSGLVSIDDVRGPQVLAYASPAALERLTELGYLWQRLPDPGLNPEARMDLAERASLGLWDSYPTYTARSVCKTAVWSASGWPTISGSPRLTSPLADPSSNPPTSPPPTKWWVPLDYREPLPTPIADFGYTQLADLGVRFTNKSINGISYHWNFGDGTTSRQKDPIHFFPSVGNYSVKLYVSTNPSFDGYGVIDSVTISVSVSVVSLTTNFSVTTAGNYAYFQSTSTTAGESFWEFGDGTTSSEINPLHLYPSSGAFIAKLTQGGVSKEIAVNTGVNPLIVPPQAGFRVEKTPITTLCRCIENSLIKTKHLRASRTFCLGP